MLRNNFNHVGREFMLFEQGHSVTLVRNYPACTLLRRKFIVNVIVTLIFYKMCGACEFADIMVIRCNLA